MKDKHDAAQHDNSRAQRTARSATAYMNDLQEQLGVRALLVTVEPCGCINFQGNMPPEMEANALMRVVSFRGTEIDH